MGHEVVDLYGDLLLVLKGDRRGHSTAVGWKAAAEAWRVKPAIRADLVAAGCCTTSAMATS